MHTLARNAEVGDYTGANQYLADIAYTYRDQKRDTKLTIQSDVITKIAGDTYINSAFSDIY